MPVLIVKRTEMFAPSQEVDESKALCQYCNRSFKTFHGKAIHEKSCFLKSTNDREGKYIKNNYFLSFKYDA